MTPTTPGVPATEELQRQSGELAAMRRMLEASHGSFSLSIAVCNSPALRDHLVSDLRDGCSGVEVLVVPLNTVDVFGYVAGAANDPTRSAIFLTGLEKSIPDSGEENASLRSLNASRELWQTRFPCPLVLWLPEFAARSLSIHARDFWRYRSHRFEFVSWRAGAAAGRIDPLSGDNRAVAALTTEEKRFRIAELEQRVSDAGAKPAANLIPHVLAWLEEIVYLHLFLGETESAEQWGRRMLDHVPAVMGSAGEATIWNTSAEIDLRKGSYADAREKYGKALTVWQGFGDPKGEASALRQLASIEVRQGAYDAAREKLGRALTIDQAAGWRYGEAADLHELASVDFDQGAYDAVREKLGRAIAIRRSIGDLYGETESLHDLASTEVEQGDYDGAWKELKTVLEMCQALGDRKGEADALHQLASIDLERGAYDAAGDKFVRALNIRLEIGDRAGEASALHQLATLDLRHEAFGAAYEKFRRALDVVQAISIRASEAAIFHQLGVLAIAMGRSAAGLRLMWVCYGIDKEIGYGDAEMDLNNATRQGTLLGYKKAQMQAMLQEVEAAYQRDRGRSLIEAAFSAEGTEEGESSE
jgi:tetratricopeptide (TPR) repeat protein